MVAQRYIPGRGDLVWIDFNPQAGREQAGRRPALVVSPEAYNERSGLMLACPITSQVKDYPFVVPLPAGLRVRGAILADQVRSLDWQARDSEFGGRVPAIVVNRVIAALISLLG